MGLLRYRETGVWVSRMIGDGQLIVWNRSGESLELEVFGSSKKNKVGLVLLDVLQLIDTM